MEAFNGGAYDEVGKGTVEIEEGFEGKDVVGGKTVCEVENGVRFENSRIPCQGEVLENVCSFISFGAQEFCIGCELSLVRLVRERSV